MVLKRSFIKHRIVKYFFVYINKYIFKREKIKPKLQGVDEKKQST